MKKLSFLLLVISFLLLVSMPVSFAQKTSIIPLEVASKVSPTPVPVAYQLPFPGLLPDNPLYFLKTMRDRLVVFWFLIH